MSSSSNSSSCLISSPTSNGPFDTPTRRPSGQDSQSGYITKLKLPAPYDAVEEVEEESNSEVSDGSPQRLRNSKFRSSQRRTHRYDRQFSLRDPTGTPRERVNQESPIIAELRTSAIVQDEYTLLTSMSCQLSLRYNRPQSHITVHVEHSASLILGGSFDASYMLTVTALPSLVQPVTNKRNAALIQSFMEKLLSVPPERGIIRFQAIAEENVATDGTTVLSKVESLEAQQAELNTSPLKHTRSVIGDGLRKAKSTVQLPGTGRHRSQPAPKGGGAIECDKAATAGLGRRKSIWSFLRR